MNPIQISITASTVAWIALIISVISASAQIISLFKDRKLIKLKVQRKMFVIGATTAYGYKEGVTYVSLNILNKSRRKITLDTAGAVLLDGSGLIAADILKSGQIVLDEGKRHNVFIEEDRLDFSKIAYFFVSDAVGDKYRQNVANIFRRMFWWTRRRIFRSKNTSK